MNFLDKLEKVSLTSEYSTYLIPNSQGKPTIRIGPYTCPNTDIEKGYLKDFIDYLKNPEVNSKYRFAIEFFDYNEYDKWIMEDILNLNPTDDDFACLYNNLRFFESEIPRFLALLKSKHHFMEFLNKGNSSAFSVKNDKEFLEKCLQQGKKFHFSLEDYYDIFYSYLKHSKLINNKDSLFKLFSQYISDQSRLENLFGLLYKVENTNNNIAYIKTIQKIELSNFGLMKNYKFMDSEELNVLLSFFVESINQNIDRLLQTTSVEKFKTETTSHDIKYSLLVDTTNTSEILDLLDLYLHYFVQFNNSAKDFTESLKDNPHIFQNLILNKKLNDKLSIKDNANTIRKI